MTQPRNYARAASFAFAAFALWTVNDMLLKLVRSSGIPEGQMMMIAGLTGMAMIFVTTTLRGHTRRLQPHKWRGLFAIGICQWLAFTLWVTALPSLSLTHMYIVAFMTPLAVGILAAVVLKEHLGWKRGIAIAIGFVGVVIAMNPVGLLAGRHPFTPYLFVFGNMLATATQMLLLRAVSHKESSESCAFYPRTVMVVGGMMACATTGFAAMPNWAFAAMCVSGVISASGWAMMSQAYKNAPAASVAPIQYTQMILGALLGYLVWGDVPGPWLIGGSCVIIVSGIYLVRHERRMSRTLVRVD